ncbi:MAG: alpha/beta fold hydrolase [Chloroflexi bacterium]|nr:alpha/beta fold hydrolase [Chloroflexota bacterium]
MAAQEGHRLSTGQLRVFDSMVELLGRAGLGYQGGFVDAGGHKIHYLDYGSGPTILLIHGGGSGSAVWFRQIEELSKRFRVIAPDNPIFGLSSQPALAVTVPLLTTGFIGSFMDAMQIDRASIAGLSMGGYAAGRFAAEHPDRVDRLALIDSAGFGRDLPWGFRLSSLPLLKYVFTRPQRWAHERFFASSEVVNPDGEHNDAYLEYAYSVMENDGHALAIRSNIPVFAGFRGQRNLLGARDLASINAETLVIWGRQDRFFPLSHANRAVSLIPNSRLEVLEDCGHVSLLDQPQQVNRLLEQFMTNGSAAKPVSG